MVSDYPPSSASFICGVVVLWRCSVEVRAIRDAGRSLGGEVVNRRLTSGKVPLENTLRRWSATISTTTTTFEALLVEVG